MLFRSDTNPLSRAGRGFLQARCFLMRSLHLQGSISSALPKTAFFYIQAKKKTADFSFLPSPLFSFPSDFPRRPGVFVVLSVLRQASGILMRSSCLSSKPSSIFFGDEHKRLLTTDIQTAFSTPLRFQLHPYILSYPAQFVPG